jgi:hypothetical protein
VPYLQVLLTTLSLCKNCWKWDSLRCLSLLQDSEVYSNVVVVQHDDELIMPGDAAFTLECDFSRPRDITVSANLEADRSVHLCEGESKAIIKGSDDSAQHAELLDFFTLSIVQYSKEH